MPDETALTEKYVSDATNAIRWLLVGGFIAMALITAVVAFDDQEKLRTANKPTIAEISATMALACPGTIEVHANRKCADQVAQRLQADALRTLEITNQNRENRNSLLLLLVSSVSLLVSAVTLYFLGQSLSSTHRAALAAEKASGAAIAANNGFEQNANRQLRAYVAVTRSVAKLEVGAIPRCVIDYQNSGQTPAQKLRVFIQANALDSNSELDFTKHPAGSAQRSVGPGCIEHADAIGPQLSQADFDQLLDGSKKLVCWGKIEYEDVFGFSRVTNFRRRMEPYISPNGFFDLKFDKSGGNDAT